MVDVLAVGAHPDDVELRIGGTLAAFHRLGASVAVVHLTRGEAATRGNPDTRREEAEAAARTLGVETMEILDLGDGRLTDDSASREALIRVIRTMAPRLLLAPFPADEHPDHTAAGLLARATWYLSGIQNAGAPELKAHRPRSLWMYPCHEAPEATFVVGLEERDVETKREALACYRSQFHDPESTEAETRISQPGFMDEISARMRHYGSLVGAPFGEAFLTSGPFLVPNPLDVLP